MSRLRLCSMSVGVVCQRSYDAMPRLALARTCDTDRMSVAVSAVACGVRTQYGRGFTVPGAARTLAHLPFELCKSRSS